MGLAFVYVLFYFFLGHAYMAVENVRPQRVPPRGVRARVRHPLR